jgi:hypothetical protein
MLNVIPEGTPQMILKKILQLSRRKSDSGNHAIL